jgi:ABC-type Mn2+/Zn2+ transport system ATPase subunit
MICSLSTCLQPDGAQPKKGKKEMRKKKKKKKNQKIKYREQNQKEKKKFGEGVEKVIFVRPWSMRRCFILFMMKGT